MIGTSSVFAAFIVILMAISVRKCPAKQREGFTILFPFFCLSFAMWSIFARIGFDMEHYVATFIYSAAAFGFSIHNFHFSQRFHFVNGIVSSLFTGVFLIFLCSSLASRAAFKNMDATSLLWVSEIAFLVCWSSAVYAVFVHRRRSLHAPGQSSSNTDS